MKTRVSTGKVNKAVRAHIAYNKAATGLAKAMKGLSDSEFQEYLNQYESKRKETRPCSADALIGKSQRQSAQHSNS